MASVHLSPSSTVLRSYLFHVESTSYAAAFGFFFFTTTGYSSVSLKLFRVRHALYRQQFSLYYIYGLHEKSKACQKLPNTHCLCTEKYKEKNPAGLDREILWRLPS